MNKPTLGYWDLRGLGQPIRLMLAYAGVDYVDKRYNIGPNFDRSEWLNEKFNLGLDFPNLPYYMDGDVKITQSMAILRYLARKYNMDGTNEQERLRISMAEQQTHDMFMAMVRICYDPNMENLRVDYLKTLPDSLKLMEKFLANHDYIAGSKISYADFYLYEYLCRMKVMVPEVYGQFENLKKFVERIESLPRIAEYIKKQKPTTFNASLAKWNGSYA
ncbi:glutathione S-transferase [Dermatophagoides farinae]|uniref:Glutathione S-transferase n=2 Tax=Dermatophagoides farinae TaxID=6954 RepID=A0A922HY36_DERFA|nr:glutathione S-transferase-like [Dermatophagoides farinae]KAH7644654.1 glutathione transferase mu class [Dermatophagoides farinae]KAH9511751.1 glutathione transferase [Dermatophagoides farinae]